MAAIIFDFDGTIADSFEYVSDFLVREARLAPLDPVAKKTLRGLSTVGMARHLGFHWWDAPRLLFHGQRRMQDRIKNLHGFPGMNDAIRKLHAEGHQLFVVSNNSAKNIQAFLVHQKIAEYFTDIYGSAGIFSKAPTLRQVLRKYNLEAIDAVYVGDEWRDVRAAHRANMRAVAVSWGFASRRKLLRMKPMAVVDNTEELLRILEEI